MNIDHFKISIALEEKNQSHLFFLRVCIQLKHRKRNFDHFRLEICNWATEKSCRGVFCVLRINSGSTERLNFW